MAKENIISINNLAFSYKVDKDKKALDNINLNIDKGQFVVIMGPSGAGKSTLANSLNGLIPNFFRGEYSGEVIVEGINPKENMVSKMAKSIGLVFQDFEAQLFSTSTLLEIAFGPENFGVERDEISNRIDEVLKTIKLEGFEGRQPSTLSGGQKQRLAIGSVLATKANIICMDEPTTDLDPIGKLGIFSIAKDLHKDSEFTLIIIEHETEEALNADRLILMNNGKIVKDGKPKDILKETEYFDSLGIMPLQIPKFFSGISNVKKEELPLTPDEGVELFKKLKLKFDKSEYEKLINKDMEREKNYGEVLIKANNLHHTYKNGNHVLLGINLEVKAGEFLAILGQNGSGKTTLVKHFNGLLMPTEGEIIVNNINTKKTSIYNIGKDVGYVFQNPDHQIFADTVYEEVEFGLKLREFPKDEIDERVKEALKAVKMEGTESEDPFALMKGGRQRVAVASVLSSRPKIIILDEPTTGLDYKEQRAMMELIKSLNEKGHTIIMITHTMWVVAEYAHKVAVINDGKIDLYGTTREVFSHEKELEEAFLKPPNIVSMSNKLGKIILSIDEIKECVKEDS